MCFQNSRILCSGVDNLPFDGRISGVSRLIGYLHVPACLSVKPDWMIAYPRIVSNVTFNRDDLKIAGIKRCGIPKKNTTVWAMFMVLLLLP